jgi:hypothetical protein
MKAFILRQMQSRRQLRRMPHEAAVRSLHQKLLRLVQLYGSNLPLTGAEIASASEEVCQAAARFIREI